MSFSDSTKSLILTKAPAGDRADVVSGWLRWAFVLVLAMALVFYAAYTWRWPMMVDSPVMHYVIFLMRHGLRPYRDITDNNMPGTYLLERCAMSVFGGGDLGWRLYDLFLSTALTLSMVVIARPYDWLAGLYAGGLFALRHGSEGAWFAAEREQEMTVLVAASCALLFLAVRRRMPTLAVGFGLFAGMAASVKPTLAPFGLLSLVVLGVMLNRRNTSSLPYLLWGLAGMAGALALDGLFLLRYGAFHAFWFVLRTVTPVYVVLNHPGKRFLVIHVAPFEILPLAALAAVVLVRCRRWDWERTVLLLAAFCGLLSYFVQQKGFFHHRYLFVAFALLLVSLEVVPLTRQAQRDRVLGWAALLYAMLYLIPVDLRALPRLPGASALTMAMSADLERLGGGGGLQGQVQCFDLTFGCLNALYHLRLVENTGFTGDLLLFPLRSNPATAFYRDQFWKVQAAHPAGVLVLTNQEFGHKNSFNRVARWPEFSAYLAQNYHLAVSRSFPFEDKYRGQSPEPPAAAPAYRLYVRNGETFGRFGDRP